MSTHPGKLGGNGILTRRFLKRPWNRGQVHEERKGKIWTTRGGQNTLRAGEKRKKGCGKRIDREGEMPTYVAWVKH